MALVGHGSEFRLAMVYERRAVIHDIIGYAEEDPPDFVSTAEPGGRELLAILNYHYRYRFVAACWLTEAAPSVAAGRPPCGRAA